MDGRTIRAKLMDIIRCRVTSPRLLMNSRRMVLSRCGLSFNPKPGTDRRLLRRRFGRSVCSLTRNAHASGLRLNDLRLNRYYS